MLLLTSCARHEGFHDCEVRPEMNETLFLYYELISEETNSPLTKQEGLQVLMGTQGVLECDFTGM